MILKMIRFILGHLIVFINFVTRPSQLKRSAADQEKVDADTKKLTLYQFHGCPFCVRVRRHIHRLNLSIELRDAKNNATHRDALLAGGGKIKAPCLRIEDENGTTWMYESLAINDYLTTRFQ